MNFWAKYPQTSDDDQEHVSALVHTRANSTKASHTYAVLNTKMQTEAIVLVAVGDAARIWEAVIYSVEHGGKLPGPQWNLN